MRVRGWVTVVISSAAQHESEEPKLGVRGEHRDVETATTVGRDTVI